MDDKFTQVKSDKKQQTTTSSSDHGASSASLSFLKMFARSYYVEPSLPVEINATCVN